MLHSSTSSSVLAAYAASPAPAIAGQTTPEVPVTNKSVQTNLDVFEQIFTGVKKFPYHDAAHKSQGQWAVEV